MRLLNGQGLASRLWRAVCAGIALAISCRPVAAAQLYDPKPWLRDVDVMQAAFSEKYANFDWAVFQREADLTAMFSRTRERIGVATNDAQARAAIDRFTQQLGDAHVVVEWSQMAPPQSSSATRVSTGSAAQCERLGYSTAIGGRAIAAYLRGYTALEADTETEFPAGVIEVQGRRVGFLRIGAFTPKMSPALCRSSLKEFASIEGGCDDACASNVEDAAYTELSRDLAHRLRDLERAGVVFLVIDITRNGGGSEWAEAAARMLTPKRITSEHRGFVRGPHWAKTWNELARSLRVAATTETGTERSRLLSWAGLADQAKTQALTPCSSAPYWEGSRPTCSWLGDGFYATGILAEADPVALHKKPWGPLVFSPAQFDFEPGVWRRPLAVLVDENTFSAAEEFAAVLQDNGAALVVGSVTGGAGCGHTDGGTPTTLPNSGGILELPDCARFRRDGSNEVAGLTPQVLLPFRSPDGIRHEAQQLQTALPEIERAWHALGASGNE